ncbi:hypothetical protein MMC14_008021 [Varicellaria rhodocarpa]|nr:hypothetical protein [Varicellaria rhodocarpa]
MSIPNEALQKLVQEIEAQAIQAQREINVVKTAVSGKQRDVRLLELTHSEVKSLPTNTKVYEGVGKMFVSNPTDAVEKRLSAETAELKSDISNLNKKLHYLETTHKNSREHIDQIFRSGERS